jgi:S-adenosylmethionine hydrolase
MGGEVPVIITLTTDFGTDDPFAGIMKGVIASINPEAVVIDLTHGIGPQDVREGAFVLAFGARHFPKGTIHVAVVDPGVGGARRAIVVRAGDYLFVGPDNGVFSWAAGDFTRAVVREITRPDYMGPSISATFHGRDVFAPAAAHLSRGVHPEELGPQVTDPVLLPFPRPERTDTEVVGEVLYIDRFGNLITNIDPPDRELVREVAVGAMKIAGVGTSYGEGGPGEAVALVGSSGYLEIAVNLGSAQRLLSASVGDRVRVRIGNP